MNETDWLIAATAAGPFIGALAGSGLTRAIRQLATVRAQRVQHIPADGTDLYHNGVPLTEAEFTAVFAAYQTELAELPPPAERTEWEMKRQFAAAQRLAILTGTHTQAFPNVGDADRAWEWYAANNRYATQAPSENRWTLQDLTQIPAVPAPRASTGPGPVRG